MCIQPFSAFATAPAQPHAPEHSIVLCHCICQLYQIVHAAALVQSMRPPENTNIARVKNSYKSCLSTVFYILHAHVPMIM